jgi:vacuolar-type H+-ATPase subunit C/Vma6
MSAARPSAGRTRDFVAAGVRARGLLAHLLSRAELESLAAQEPTQLLLSLGRSPELSGSTAEGPQEQRLERALRLTARRHLATLARWEGSGPGLEVFAAEQDRRSLRTLLRGALQGAPAERRLSGLLPTQTLPERVLLELARQPTPAALVSHLFVLGHPDGERLLPLTSKHAQPELFALELVLLQGFAARATRGARGGDETLRAFVAHRLDALNAQNAMLLGASPDVEPDRCFVPGGELLGREDFLAAAKARTPDGAAARLERALAHTPLARLVEPQAAVDAGRLERRAFVLSLEEARRASRLEPSGSGPVLLFLLRLEAMARDVRRLAWGAFLHAPPSLLKAELVTPWP